MAGGRIKKTKAKGFRDVATDHDDFYVIYFSKVFPTVLWSLLRSNLATGKWCNGKGWYFFMLPFSEIVLLVCCMYVDMQCTWIVYVCLCMCMWTVDAYRIRGATHNKNISCIWHYIKILHASTYKHWDRQQPLGAILLRANRALNSGLSNLGGQSNGRWAQ